MTHNITAMTEAELDRVPRRSETAQRENVTFYKRLGFDVVLERAERQAAQ